MQRGFSILLALWFGLMPLAPALQGSDDANLPACCRRHGVHHCAMSDEAVAHILAAISHQPAFTAPSHCPLYPRHGHATTQTNQAIGAMAAGVFSSSQQALIASNSGSTPTIGVEISYSGRAPPFNLYS
jgi:hypothetical protein